MIECQKTPRFEEVYAKAVQNATQGKHTEVTTAHFLLAMIEVEDVRHLLEREMDVFTVHQTLLAILKKLPKVEGETRLCLSSALNSVIDLAIGKTRPRGAPEKSLDLDHVIEAIPCGDPVFSELFPLALVKIFLIDRRREGVLLQYGRDLGRGSSQVFGRSQEIKEVGQVLSRFQQHHPILVGGEGTGKTAVIRGLAKWMKDSSAPNAIRGKRIFLLDMASVVAGTSLRGALEERMSSILDAVRGYGGQMVLFLDDVHEIVTQDAFRLCVRAIQAGEIQCIAATTSEHFVKHRGMLHRIFQQITLDPPSPKQTLRILRGVAYPLERHHEVRIHSDALQACISLTGRYTPSRPQPRASLEALDAACALRKAEMCQLPPRAIEIEETMEELRQSLHDLERDPQMGVTASKNGDSQRAILAQLKELAGELSRVTWMASLVQEARAEAWSAMAAGDRSRAQKVAATLEKLGEPSVTLRDVVTNEDIAKVIAAWTGIPVTKMGKGDAAKLVQMEGFLSVRVKGQEGAVEKVSSVVRQARAGLCDPNRPQGSFMFMGPTGVGKTELAKALADFLFGDEAAMIRLDMSEYMEKHTVSRLIGSPPGYVGHDQGGVLTDAVRQKPYAVLLLDEVEKAHPDVLNLLLQVLDEGRLTDSRGIVVDFKHALVILTTNIGADAAFLPEEEATEARQEALRRAFRPEFLNRLDAVIPFKPLQLQHMGDILDLQMHRLSQRLAVRKMVLLPSKEALSWLAQTGYDPKYGARPLRRVVQDYIIDPLSSKILSGEYPDGSHITLGWSEPEGLVFTTSQGKDLG